MNDIKLGVPYLYKNKLIVIFEYRTISPSVVYLKYYSYEDYGRYLKMNIVPRSSVDDKTFRTLHERSGSRTPFERSSEVLIEDINTNLIRV